MQKEIIYTQGARRNELFFLAVSLIILPLTISSDSLWVDEAYNALFALKHSFIDFLKYFLANTRSENQMPLGMFASWIGGRALGVSEWSLRAINIIWGIVTVVCFYVLGKRFRMPWLPLFMAIQPFFWYYLNEARPYAMQIASGSLLLISCVEADENCNREVNWLPSFILGAILLCGSSLLGVFPFFFWFIVISVILVKKSYNPSKGSILALGAMLIILAALALFYLWTLMRGAGGAKIWKPGWENIAYAFYDFLGFGGLGPSRNELRSLAKVEGGIIHGIKGYIPGLLMLATCYTAVLVMFIRTKCISCRMIKHDLAVFAGTCVAILGVSYAIKWPFWGRHLSAIFPISVFLIAFSIHQTLNRKNIFGKVLLGALSILLVASALNLRFGSEHAKDDYRDAAAEAKSNLLLGRPVWWAADLAAAEYYQVIPSYPSTGASVTTIGKFHAIQNADSSSINQLPIPGTVILSKRDIYDPVGILQDWMNKHQFKLQKKWTAFEVWRQ